MDRNQTAKRNEFVPWVKLKSYKLKNYNFRLVLLLMAICALGVAIVGSANTGGDSKAVFKQAMGVAVGMGGMVIISLIDYDWILKIYWLIYLFNAGLLGVTLLFGKTRHGATRWLEAPGTLGSYISIQPSEFSKIFLILFFAKFLSANKERVSKWWFMAITAILAAIPLYLIYEEPDLSTTLLTAMLIITIIFAAGLTYRKIGIILALLVPVGAALLIYIQQPEQKLLDTYQLNRILSFIYPEEYDSLRYQQDNSVLAIGSGRLNGKGLYNDSVESMKNANYLSREAVNDFIFAIIGEELGFVGSCIVLGLMFLIIAECFISAILAPDMTGRMICAGMAMLLTIQTFINVGVATEILPNTGIPLPFISSGLSSLVSLLGGMGFVLNINLQKVKQ